MAISLDLDANNSTGGGFDATATFTEDGAGAPIGDVDVSITNSTGGTLSSATITLGINRMPGDLLSINGTLPAGITASAYNPTTGVLILGGTASLAAYQTALHQVVFSTPSQNPSTADRIITVSVSDGVNVSNTGTAFIHVVSVPDPPVNTLPASLTANENVTTPIGGLSVADADSATLTTTLDVIHGALVVSAAGGISVTGSGTGHLVLSGAIAALNTTLGTLTYTGTLNFTGADTLTMSTTDGGLTDIDTAAIAVNGVNAAPVAQDGNASGAEDTPISGVLVATDVDSPVLTYSLVGQAAHGTVVVNTTNGTYTYTPNADFNGSDSFTFRANDGQLDSNVATISLNVAPVNDAPVAQNGSASGNEDTPINGTLIATDVDSPTLSYNLVAQAAHGTVVVNLDGTYTYTPNADFNGIDSFTFAANDGLLPSNVATVNLTVAPVNDPPAVPAIPSGLSVNEDTVLPIAGAAVSDVDSPTLTTILSVGHGVLNVTPSGANITGDGTGSVTIVGSVTDTNAALLGLTYHPDLNFNGLDVLNFTTTDEQFTRGTLRFISVLPVNDAPSGADNTVTTVENAPYALHAGDFGFSDVDGNTLFAVELTTLPSAGALTLNGAAVAAGDFISATEIAAGHLVYTSPLNASGTALDSFTFQVQDDGGVANGGIDLDPSPNTISIDVSAVNNPPVAQDGTASGNEDTPISGTLVATDIDSPALTYSLFAQAAHGTVVVNTTDGSYTYTPNADFNGSDSFTFRANDGALDSNVATVSLTINPVNDAPVAQDGTADGNEDTPISGTLVATDVDNPTLTYSLVAQAANGLVAVNPDGSYTYTPNPNFNGTDAFTFKANDGALDSNIATIVVTVEPVNDAPVAQDGSAGGLEDTPISGMLVANEIDGPSLGFSLVAQAAHGTVVVNPNGSYTYTPNADFNGADSFTFKANDGLIDSNVARISLTVAPVNDAPVALDGSADGNEGASITGALFASDVDSPALAYSLVGQAAHGTVVVLPIGIFHYTPDADFNGTDFFTFKANDGQLDSNVATVTLSIDPVNSAPVAQDGSASGNEDTPISGTLIATDVDSPTLSYSLVAQAAHGAVVVNPDGSYTYTPDADFNGSDSFTFAANDGQLDSNAATVSLTVDPVNDAPVNILVPAARLQKGLGFSFLGLGVTDVDAGTGALTTVLSVGNGTITVVPGAALVGGNGTGSVTITGTLDDLNAALGSFLYQPAPGTAGDTLVMTTDDNGNTGSGGPRQDTLTVSFTVNADQPPSSLALSHSAVDEFSPDGTVVGALTATDPDPGDTFTFTLLNDAGGRFAIDGTNMVVRHGLLLDFEQAASHIVTVQVTDASGAALQQDFTIAIGNVDPENIVASATLTGGPGVITIVGGPLDDRFDLGPGDHVVTGAGGDDTVVYATTLGATTPDNFGQWIDIGRPDGADRLFAIEHLQFTDGTVNVADGDGLFDTLFYDYHYQDVFHAGVDARQHYETIGWLEGRDPNAFFSTQEYIAAYEAALASGSGSARGAGGTGTAGLQNPLEHYRDTGWREGFDPSLDFDTTLYLIHNPDVAAAGINPLEHFLQSGRAEGRAAYPAIGQIITPIGFDAEFYLMSNPDVAAAGVDPLTHYETLGWKEGRNPNRYFDTAGYLAHYTDVAASGIDPLTHYAQFGWKEGRDPSGAFDTLGYLAANGDVAAAHVDPLTQFLQSGIYEGRDPHADGVFH